MYHIPYMLLKNQLMDQLKAKLIIEGVEVYFEVNPENNIWTVKSRIYYPLDVLTPSLKENLQTLDYVKIQTHGAFLKAYPEEGFVILSQQMKAIPDFLIFKVTIQQFMSTYDFWKSVVDDMIKSDGLLLT